MAAVEHAALAHQRGGHVRRRLPPRRVKVLPEKGIGEARAVREQVLDGDVAVRRDEAEAVAGLAQRARRVRLARRADLGHPHVRPLGQQRGDLGVEPAREEPVLDQRCRRHADDRLGHRAHAKDGVGSVCAGRVHEEVTVALHGHH